MGILVRMFEKQKWEVEGLAEMGANKAPADAITADLRTRANTLSFWYIENIGYLSDAVLALALMRNQITRLDVMLIEEFQFESNGLKYINTPKNGHTPLNGFRDFHYDLIELDYEKLGAFTQIVLDNLNDQEKCIRYPKQDIANFLYDAYVEKRFNLYDIHEKLREDLEKVIKRKE